VAHLVVNGTIVGPVHAADFGRAAARSRVTGDVHYASIEMHLGAVVDGGWCTRALRPEPKAVELKLAKTQ